MLINPEPIEKQYPEEPGVWVKFKRLSARQLQKARQAKELEDAPIMRELGGRFAKAMQEDDGGDPVEARRKRKQLHERMKEFRWDITQFDIPTLMEKSIDSWSYDAPPGKDPADQVDPEFAEWCGETIIAISRRKTRRQEKNSPAASTPR